MEAYNFNVKNFKNYLLFSLVNIALFFLIIGAFAVLFLNGALLDFSVFITNNLSFLIFFSPAALYLLISVLIQRKWPNRMKKPDRAFRNAFRAVVLIIIFLLISAFPKIQRSLFLSRIAAAEYEFKEITARINNYKKDYAVFPEKSFLNEAGFSKSAFNRKLIYAKDTKEIESYYPEKLRQTLNSGEEACSLFVPVRNNFLVYDSRCSEPFYLIKKAQRGYDTAPLGISPEVLYGIKQKLK